MNINPDVSKLDEMLNARRIPPNDWQLSVVIEIDHTKHPGILDDIIRTSTPTLIGALPFPLPLLLHIPVISPIAKIRNTEPRFHFYPCQTINDKTKKGKLDRYILTNETSGEFEIWDNGVKGKRRLKACKHCIALYNKQLAKDKLGMQVTCASFDIKEFFEHCKPIFPELPPRVASLIRHKYPENWKGISSKYRQIQNGICEECGVDLSNHRDLLHTHHKNGVKSDTSINNLQALCKLCHRKIHDNSMFLPQADEKTILELRTQQGIHPASTSR